MYVILLTEKNWGENVETMKFDLAEPVIRYGWMETWLLYRKGYLATVQASQNINSRIFASYSCVLLVVCHTHTIDRCAFYLHPLEFELPGVAPKTTDIYRGDQKILLVHSIKSNQISIYWSKHLFSLLYRPTIRRSSTNKCIVHPNGLDESDSQPTMKNDPSNNFAELTET